MKLGIVEMINDKKILVGFSDGTYKTYINTLNLDINENDEVEIEDEVITKVRGINQELYKEIKDIENKVFNKK